MFFSKAPTAVNGPFDNVPAAHGGYRRRLTGGGAGRDDAARGAATSTPATAPSRNVFGYTVINDVTARDLQQRHTQWFKGKSLDGSCPMGPVIVTVDEFGDPQDKRISLSRKRRDQAGPPAPPT